MAAIETRGYLKTVSWCSTWKGLITGFSCILFGVFVMMPVDVYGAQRFRLPLFQLAPYPIAELRGSEDIVNIKVPVPRRWQIEKALLHFEYANTTALDSQLSNLVVRFNGYPLVQTTLRSDSPSGKMDTEIPAPYLLPDYNDLDFQVFQNYDRGCKGPDDRELWTMLDIKNSYLEFDYSLKPIPLSLTSISRYLFDPKMPDTARVHVAVESLDEPSLRLAAVAASAVAEHFEYRPVLFSISTSLVPGRDNLIIGSRGYLQGQLNGTALPDGQLGLMHLPVGEPETRDRWGLVVITGENTEALERSALAFSVMNDPLPDSPFTAIKTLQLPEVNRYLGKQMMVPGKTYSFKALGFVNQTRSGTRAWDINLDFRVPTDFLIKTNEAVLITLHLAYGAKMRSDSVMNVLLNGLFMTAIPLDDTNGGTYLAYKIELPHRFLDPGLNRLTFQPVLTPSESGECVYKQTDHLRVAVYDDSEISVPEMDRWAAMPDLALFFKDGFPLTRWPDWRETIVCLPENSEASAAAALNLVAAICQKKQVGPWGISFKLGAFPETDKDLMVVGPLDHLPRGLDASSLLAQTIHYSAQEDTSGLRRTAGWVKKWLSPGKTLNEASQAEVVLEAVLPPGRLMIKEYESPHQATRTVLLLTAREEQTLANGALSLWNPAVQNRLAKSLAIIDITGEQEQISCYQAGPQYHVGEIGSISILDHLVHEQPWYFFMALVVLLILLSWILWIVLRRRKRKRLGNVSDSE